MTSSIRDTELKADNSTNIIDYNNGELRFILQLYFFNISMKYVKLREIGKNILKENNILDYDFDSKELLLFALKTDLKDYLLKMNDECEKSIEAKYLSYIDKRKKHIPLQHITHEMNFYGYSFYVNKDVLIPRFDTEILVEEALKKIKSGDKILDMCTGSGCIIISILKKKGKTKGVGIDISDKALLVANKNSKKLLVSDRIKLIKSDLFNELKEMEFDIIISNPPYIREADIDSLSDEVKCYDPYIALCGGEDGLYFYRKIAKESKKFLKHGGYLFFEIGYDEAKSVKEILLKNDFCDIEIKSDLNGFNRVVSGKNKKF